MKKINKVIVISLLFAFILSIFTSDSFCGLRLKAAEQLTVKLNENGFVPKESLIGTKYEGCEIQEIDGELYLIEENGEKRSIKKVAVYIAGILAGYVIDDTLVYLTGYNGREIYDSAVRNTVMILKNKPNINKVNFYSASSQYPDSYSITTGQQCVRQKNGPNYVCAYSVDE